MLTLREEVDNAKKESRECKSGLSRVRAYAKLLCPDNPDAGAAVPWEVALMAESPTLLPTLKFHQLVFGHGDLGKGAFSVVRYARAIDKEKTQSQWPEYAVKIIDTKTMEDLGYEACVNREICVLRMISHPGVARMVSSFRWRDGAYLVLEYASKGDLHSLLVRMGKLPEGMVQFFVGEAVAALSAIHELGFVYGDLKPENIVITSTCHAKLTDFGGCRPITAEALDRTRMSLLRALRDGDWRALDAEDSAVNAAYDAGSNEAGLVDDARVEGTTLYLPPEVVRGSAPTLAADAWALGCLVSQLLSGKPPIWVESGHEEDLRSRIVSFSPSDVTSGLETLSEAAQNLASKLLNADPEARLPVAAAASDPFFEGLDVFTLYRRPRGPDVPSFDKAAVPEGDERWQKRQLSKIWTVMPTSQDYTLPDAVAKGHVASSVIDETDVELGEAFCDDVRGPFPAARRIEAL